MSTYPILKAIALAQCLLGLRVAGRLLHSAGGVRLRRSDTAPSGERIAVVVPVLDERDRLAPCLEGLIAQGAEVAEILVVDGGSRDGTQRLVLDFQTRDARVRLVDAQPIPHGWNGKAWGLQVGLEQGSAATAWVLTIDADVRPAAPLARSLLAHADRARLDALSVATLQVLGTRGEGLVHPAMLATLIYRFGIPGRTFDHVAEVQANGQCFLFRRASLESRGGFAVARDSLCEDVTVARCLVAAGCRVGFYETDGLASVEMYASWREAWANWTRSLPMRDRFAGGSAWLGLLEVTLVQALPLPLALTLRFLRAPTPWALALNSLLAVVRFGILVGAARAYARRPWSYWLSPLLDLPVAAKLWASTLRRHHTWRGRALIQGDR
jgi:dolichol-phosphate mannosyltransferase